MSICCVPDSVLAGLQQRTGLLLWVVQYSQSVTDIDLGLRLTNFFLISEVKPTILQIFISKYIFPRPLSSSWFTLP